jgi:hypothetical protein
MSDQSLGTHGPFGAMIAATDIAARADTAREGWAADTAPRPTLRDRAASLAKRASGSAAELIARARTSPSRTATIG